MNKKLYLLIGVLAAALIAVLVLIFTLQPATNIAQPDAVSTFGAGTTSSPEDSLTEDNPLAALTEEELAALAMSEEEAGHMDEDGAID